MAGMQHCTAPPERGNLQAADRRLCVISVDARNWKDVIVSVPGMFTVTRRHLQQQLADVMLLIFYGLSKYRLLSYIGVTQIFLKKLSQNISAAFHAHTVQP
jgi:hypothetical protein